MSLPTHLHINGALICFGTRQKTPAEMADALKTFVAPKPGSQTARTLEFEREGAELAAQRFEDDAGITKFIQHVCWWGGYSGIGGRVLKMSDPAEIRSQLLAAKEAIEQQVPDVQTAIRAVRAINGLGLSFASKHLRMLWPQHCPVLDSQLHSHLKYPMNSTGYRTFAADCRTVADFLAQQDTRNPARGAQPVWYVADVEAAIFQFYR